MMQENDYTLIIVLTTIGFFLLAAILLVPVYLFLKREEKASEKWTNDALRRPSSNGETPSDASSLE